MGQTTIEMDDLVDELSLLPDADAASWPSIEITIDYKTHPAEPDVDIFNEQLEIQRVTYNLDGTDYRDEDAFVSALYEHIAGDIENDESTVRAKIAEMRASAMDIRRAQRHVAAALLDDAANALEAVLDAAPCYQCGLAHDVYPANLSFNKILPPWLEATLTRAITKGEQ